MDLVANSGDLVDYLHSTVVANINHSFVWSRFDYLQADWYRWATADWDTSVFIAVISYDFQEVSIIFRLCRQFYRIYRVSVKLTRPLKHDQFITKRLIKQRKSHFCACRDVGARCMHATEKIFCFETLPLAEPTLNVMGGMGKLQPVSS